jgi:ABC-type glycerol-3-phosphate transport system substrate-binding protein
MRKPLTSSIISAVVGGTVLGLSLFVPAPAEALTDEEIVSKLQQVPVFLILNSDGQPLTATAEQVSESNQQGEEIKVPVVFLDGETAEDFLANARTEDQSAQIAAVDLGTLYQEAVVNAETETPLTLLSDY